MLNHQSLAAAVFRQALLDGRGAPQLATRRGAAAWLKTAQGNHDRAFWANVAGLDDTVVVAGRSVCPPLAHR